MAGYELVFYNADKSGGFPEYFSLYFIFGLFSSLPVLIAYYIIFILLIKKIKSVIKIKLILNALTVTGIIITFQQIFHFPVNGLTVAYSTATVIASLLLKMRLSNSTNEETNTSSLS